MWPNDNTLPIHVTIQVNNKYIEFEWVSHNFYRYFISGVSWVQTTGTLFLQTNQQALCYWEVSKIGLWCKVKYGAPFGLVNSYFAWWYWTCHWGTKSTHWLCFIRVMTVLCLVQLLIHTLLPVTHSHSVLIYIVWLFAMDSLPKL